MKQNLEMMRRRQPEQHQQMIKLLRAQPGKRQASQLNAVAKFVEEFSKEVAMTRKKGHILLNERPFIAYQIYTNGWTRVKAKKLWKKATQNPKICFKEGKDLVVAVKKHTEIDNTESVKASFQFSGDALQVGQDAASSLLTGAGPQLNSSALKGFGFAGGAGNSMMTSAIDPEEIDDDEEGSSPGEGEGEGEEEGSEDEEGEGDEEEVDDDAEEEDEDEEEEEEESEPTKKKKHGKKGKGKTEKENQRLQKRRSSPSSAAAPASKKAKGLHSAVGSGTGDGIPTAEVPKTAMQFLLARKRFEAIVETKISSFKVMTSTKCCLGGFSYCFCLFSGLPPWGRLAVNASETLRRQVVAARRNQSILFRNQSLAKHDVLVACMHACNR